MKYSCNLIQDILPLYHDGVCSEESKAIIEEHLSKCSACTEYYTEMCEADEDIMVSPNVERELQKAASFQAVKKKMLHKQIVVAASAIALLLVITFIGVNILKNSSDIVEFENNISVSMVDNSLIGRLIGSHENHVKIKNVDITINGQEKTYMFFYVSNTKWASITTNSDVFSEYVLCPEDKGAERINAVYYYSGSYAGIETMSNDELQKVIDASVLMWKK